MEAKQAEKPPTAATPAAWDRLLQRAGANAKAAPALYAELHARYAAPERAYHHLGHIGHVLYTVAALASHCPQPAAVRLAAWLHDIVYVPGAATNEALSATLATAWLAALQLPTSLCEEVARLVHLTATHDALPGDANGAVLLDADLAILGTPASTYGAYARAIRREFAHIAEGAYRSGRAGVLAGFLARPAIYRTPPMRAFYEGRARRNLARELAALQSER